MSAIEVVHLSGSHGAILHPHELAAWNVRLGSLAAVCVVLHELRVRTEKWGVTTVDMAVDYSILFLMHRGASLLAVLAKIYSGPSDSFSWASRSTARPLRI